MRRIYIHIIVIIALALLTTVIASASADNLIRIYDVHNYGNITILTLNKSLFKPVGRDFLILVLPNVSNLEIDRAAASEITKVIGSNDLIAVARVLSSKSFNVILDFVRPAARATNLTKFMSIIRSLIHAELLRIFKSRVAQFMLYGNGVIRIDIVPNASVLPINELSELITTVSAEKIVIVVRPGLWWNESNACSNVVRKLTSIPCVYGVEESFLGVSIDVDSACVEKLAREHGVNFNKELSTIVNRIRSLDSYIRMCTNPPVVIIVTKSLGPLVPLVEEVKKNSTLSTEGAASAKRPMNTPTSAALSKTALNTASYHGHRVTTARTSSIHILTLATISIIIAVSALALLSLYIKHRS